LKIKKTYFPLNEIINKNILIFIIFYLYLLSINIKINIYFVFLIKKSK